MERDVTSAGGLSTNAAWILLREVCVAFYRVGIGKGERERFHCKLTYRDGQVVIVHLWFELMIPGSVEQRLNNAAHRRITPINGRLSIQLPANLDEEGSMFSLDVGNFVDTRKDPAHKS